MIRYGDPSIAITVSAEGFDELARGMSLDNLDLLANLKKIVRKGGEDVQRQAVKNVSGSRVTWSGGTFVINRQTSKLARSIQVTHPSALSSAIIAHAAYAGAVEEGVAHPVDLKPALMGKTVFIPFSTKFGNHPMGAIAYPVQTSSKGGNSDQDPAKAAMAAVRQTMYASTGRKAGEKYGIFRKVGPHSTGWIIPPRPGRPFMRAAAEAVAPGFEAEVRKALHEHLESLGKK